MKQLVEKLMNWFIDFDHRPRFVDVNEQQVIINDLKRLSNLTQDSCPILSGDLNKISNFIFIVNGQVNLGAFGRIYEILSILQTDIKNRHKDSACKKIFISHRALDGQFADLLYEALVSLGIPRQRFFCSSLPGNDVQQQISVEVKSALKNSCLNIVLLSADYYESAYCLNEAGIIWYDEQVPIITIGLPEISEKNMWGFLNGDYKLRSLDKKENVWQIVEKCFEVTNTQKPTGDIVDKIITKLICDYKNLLKNRPQKVENTKNMAMTTDDECVLLFYIVSHNTRKIVKADVLSWLQDLEIYDINVDNAFDLYALSGRGEVVENVLELTINAFRDFTTNASQIKLEMESVVSSHFNKSSDMFMNLWNGNKLDDYEKLFVAYITDEKMDTLGDRWMAEQQVADIIKWEQKCDIKNVISDNYGKLLTTFIQNKFVYPVEWTNQGNVRKYALCSSLKQLLFDNSTQFYAEFRRLVKEYHDDTMPF